MADQADRNTARQHLPLLTSPRMWGSDADRYVTVLLLQDTMARGLLTRDEAAERMAAAFDAVHLADLEPMTADFLLPPAESAGAPGWRIVLKTAIDQLRALFRHKDTGRLNRARVALAVLLAILLLLLFGFWTEKITPAPGNATLGVGGVATPVGAIKTTSDSSSAMTITSGGSQSSPKVYDGQGHTVGTITVKGSWITVQNFNIRATGQYGVYSDGTGITIQNNDIKGIHTSGDGDLNAITFFGNNTTIAYNTAINFVSGDPGSSHTDAIQTWVSSSHPTGSSNVTIKGNKFSGPSNTSRTASTTSIHQCVMAEGVGSAANTGGSGPSTNWLIADNYFHDSWNQCIKLDDIDNVTVTRNEFAGDSDHVMEVTAASSGCKYYSDNKVTGNYGSVGITITPGSGPSS